ncbi:thioredoxin family protein [Patescibacteria group bacterium]|nr:thioredoxin family protein [Patescibacteria group bacterium]
MIIKLFTKKNCPKCPSAKNLVEELKKDGLEDALFEFFDAESVDGMAEAAFYTVMSTPSILICNDDGKEVKGWRGEVPDLKEFEELIKK